MIRDARPPDGSCLHAGMRWRHGIGGWAEMASVCRERPITPQRRISPRSIYLNEYECGEDARHFGFDDMA